MSESIQLKGEREMELARDRRRAARARILRDVGGGSEAPLRIEWRQDSQLWASRGDDARTVWVARLFPWSEPGRYVSLRDHDDEEFALVSDLASLDADSRGALEDALAEAGFVLEIAHIIHVEEEIEIRTWDVETRQGRRSFQTMRDEWPRDVPGGGILIRDVSGDLYRISDPASLDPKSRKLLWAYVD